ncbi:hypothetical protein KUTeg_020702 [Tegillarca granosa]|uniref:Uncharacterized protein n=1 Tax=Tegillarca granosa TaxID=220873 RepID=A0ABQ9E983_TEGGR|nr:hypothetical protein KUTeg_020702 [Tegillarca granosa]
MIELKKICNLLTDTTEFISSRRRELRLPPTDATDPPRLLTQEKDGCILFTWDDVEETSKSTIVTHIGLYEPSNQKYKVVWTYNQRVNIVSGTINKSRTLIAFTVYSREGSSAKKNGKDVLVLVMLRGIVLVTIWKMTKYKLFYHVYSFIKMDDMTVLLPYVQIPVYHGIPDPFLNLSVLTQSNGTFCICYQHMETPYTHDRKTPVKRSRRSPALPSPSSLSLSLSESEEDVMEINYYICMVHHSDYLMVLLPGYFVHLLNVSIEFEPCHHILLHDKSVKLCSRISNGSKDKGSTEDSRTDHLSIPKQNPQYMPAVSVLSPDASRFSHLSNTCLHKVVKDTPSSTTYVSMRRQFDREILRLIPFTASETFRGQFEKNEEGERLARVSYKSLQSVNIGMRSAKDRRRGNVGDDMWDIIRRHLRLIQVESASRFTPSTVGKTYKNMQRDIEMGKCPGVNLFSREQEDFFGSFHHRLRRSESPALGVGLESTRRVRPDTVLGLPPPFLQGNNIAESSDKIMKLTKEMLNKELTRTLSGQYKVKVSNVAKEYVSFQFQQSRQMCHLLWNLRGQLLPYTEMDFLPNLYVQSSLILDISL